MSVSTYSHEGEVTVHLSERDRDEVIRATSDAKNARNWATKQLAFRRVLDLLIPDAKPCATVVPIESLAPDPCEECGGRGWVTRNMGGNGFADYDVEATCPDCAGSGIDAREG